MIRSTYHFLFLFFLIVGCGKGEQQAGDSFTLPKSVRKLTARLEQDVAESEGPEKRSRVKIKILLNFEYPWPILPCCGGLRGVAPIRTPTSLDTTQRLPAVVEGGLAQGGDGPLQNQSLR